MENLRAISLIERAVDRTASTQLWHDFGAGSGTFTRALGSLLPSGSMVHAVDCDEAALESMDWTTDKVFLKKIGQDFASNEFLPSPSHGMLFSNSLHYMADHFDILRRLTLSLIPKGRIVVIEYDITVGNQWVPFPIPLRHLRGYARREGVRFTKLGGVQSIYQAGELYSALLEI